MTHSKIHYRDQETALTGVLVCDEARRDRRPGILVIHGGAGLDAHAEGRARRFAELGYVVFACDMYGDGVVGSRQRIVSCIAELRGDPRKLCQRAQAAIDVLTSHSLVDGKLAAVGYCFGGMAVLELARNGIELAGLVSVHGSLSTTRPAEPGSIKAPILVCHGALDPHGPPPHVTAFVDEMNRAAADWQLVVYGGAMHGFTHETATGQTPGVQYHAPSDARSSLAIKAFLDEIFTQVCDQPSW